MSTVSDFKRIVAGTVDNKNVFLRTWVPYLSFILLNYLLFSIGKTGIGLALILDTMIGIYLYRQNLHREIIIDVIKRIQKGSVKDKVDVSRMHADNIGLAEAVNLIGDGIDKAVQSSIKDEKLKADLITNVSHDIKTPLTSIINYTGLIKREKIDNPRIKEYVDVLEMKSQKLKKLTEDLLEASKISSGNINVELMTIDFVELLNQTYGETYDRFVACGLEPVFKAQEETMNIVADPRHLWRVIENLFINVCKYAVPGTRVHMNMRYKEDENYQRRKVVLSIKNITASIMDVEPSDLSERFIRGDSSRSSEGTGLGLSIAKSLTTLQGGRFDIKVEGGIFKVILTFDAA